MLKMSMTVVQLHRSLWFQINMLTFIMLFIAMALQWVYED